MAHFTVTSWQISVAQILFMLPIYALIYPLARWVCKHLKHSSRAILYAYPYAMSSLVLIGFISMATWSNKLKDAQVDSYFVMGIIKLLPFMLICNIWTHRYLKNAPSHPHPHTDDWLN